MPKLDMDKTDRKILAVLQVNGRLTNQEVAERVNLSPSPCLRRIRHLEEAGIIRHYVALLDSDKLGLGLLAYVNVKLEKRRGTSEHEVQGVRTEFEAAVAHWPEVVGCYAMTCELNYLLRIQVADMQHFSQFMTETLLKHPAVLELKSDFALQTVKETTALPLA